MLKQFIKKNKYLFWIIPAILCIVYGVLIFSANSGSDFFIVWILLGVFFVFMIFVSKFKLWSKVRRSIKRILLILLGLAFTVVAIFEVFVFSGFNKKAPDGLDYLIILGAQVYEDKPSAVLQYRLDTAIEYLKRNPETKVIVTGGKGDYEPFAEGVGMRDYLLKNGIEDGRIFVESKSSDTLENLTFAMQYLPDKSVSVGIVTNNFHIFRALWIAKDLGLENVSGLSAPSNILYLPNNCFREFFGAGKYILKTITGQVG